MANPRTAPTARFPVPKYIPKNIANGGIEKIIAKNVLTQIVLINVSVEIFCFFLWKFNHFKNYSFTINFDIVISVAIFCSTA